MRVLFPGEDNYKIMKKGMGFRNRFEKANVRKSPTELLNSKWSVANEVPQSNTAGTIIANVGKKAPC